MARRRMAARMRGREAIERMLDNEVICEAFAAGSRPIEIEGVVTPNEEALSRRIINSLVRYYPGHQWGVEIKGGLAIIRNKALVGRWAYNINLLEHGEPGLEREIRKAGGEMLERFSLRRGRPDPDALRGARYDVRGHMVPSL